MGSERLVRAAPPLALLIALAAVGPSSLHILIPLLPTLARDFAADTASAQLALTSYLVAMACAQLVYGPLSDRYGRRPVVLGALVAFLAGTALCGLSPSIAWMVLGRFIQGFGGCAGIVIGRAMIRDMHGRDKSASVIGFVTMGMAVIPAFSPAIGAYVDAWLGWRASFVLLATVGAAILAFSWLYLAETHFHPVRGGLRRLAIGHLDLMRHPAFLVYTAVTSASMASWYAFTAGAPYILVYFLDLPPTAYGQYILIPMAGYIAGNYVAARYSVRLGVDRMMFAGVWISVAAAVLFLAWTAQGVTPLSIFVPMAVSVFGNGISQPNATAGGISVNPRLAGTASGLMGFLQTVVAAIATVLIGFIQPSGPLAMVGVIVGANFLGLGSALATKFRPREAQRQGG